MYLIMNVVFLLTLSYLSVSGKCNFLQRKINISQESQTTFVLLHNGGLTVTT